ncbi:hypothetical protein [Prevotella jejuni]|uniref:hypothetical protein n=1 Tax=Prevotella jejuni TaxID=1177574 RepID=UPI002151AD04|nr:hypothetical protein [Prevotella jejuni]
MQFQIACKHCHRPFVIQSEGGNTLRCNCPYCGESMTVATPQMGVPDGSRAETTATVSHVQVERDNMNVQARPAVERKPSKGGLGKKVTIIFVSFLLFVILMSSLLYIIFSAMSN